VKAILIDPSKREIKGIEIDVPGISLMYKKAVLLQAMIGQERILYYDGTCQASQQDPFWLFGMPRVVYGKGLLLGRTKDQCPVATTLTTKDVECLVRFRS
jgi:hypothetical protein